MKKIQYLATVALLMILAACGQESSQSEETGTEGTSTGFVHIQIPSGMTKKNTVYIFAPSHCPRAEGQRADALEKQLSEKGLTVARKNNANFSATNLSDEEITKVEKTVEILNGEVPIVFVNKMGKANPSAEQVLTIYQETK